MAPIMNFIKSENNYDAREHSGSRVSVSHTSDRMVLLEITQFRSAFYCLSIAPLTKDTVPNLSAERFAIENYAKTTIYTHFECIMKSDCNSRVCVIFRASLSCWCFFLVTWICFVNRLTRFCGNCAPQFLRGLIPILNYVLIWIEQFTVRIRTGRFFFFF